LEFKQLGNSQLRVSAVGLGTAFRSGMTADAPQIIERAIDLEISLIDTAEVYHSGGSEEIVGDAIKNRRESTVIVTKVSGEHLRREDVLKAANGSVKRLGIDVIDLYLVHWPNPKIPLSETMKAMEALVENGIVRYIGVSNFDVAQLEEARSVLSRHEIVANQVKYNLIEREIEKEIFPYCRRNNIGIIAYSPLARGLLTGGFFDRSKIPTGHWRGSDPLFEGGRLARYVSIVEKLNEIAVAHGKTRGQVAMNWLAAKDGVMPIFGASNIAQVVENCGAVDWRMMDRELEMIEEAYRLLETF